MKKIILSISAVLSLLIVINSCTLNNSGSITTTQQGGFLVAQTSPNAPALSFLTNYNLFDTGLHYGIYTPYIAANPGAYSFSLLNDSSSNPTLFDTTLVTISAKQAYSYFIIDSFSKIKSVFINDVFHAPGADTTFIRFFNLCPNSPGSLNLVDSSANNVVLSANRIFNDEILNPQYTAFAPLINLTSNYNYILSLKNSSGITIKTQTIQLVTGRVYTLIAKGIYGSADSSKALSIGVLENYPQKNIGFTF